MNIINEGIADIKRKINHMEMMKSIIDRDIAQAKDEVRQLEEVLRQLERVKDLEVIAGQTAGNLEKLFQSNEPIPDTPKINGKPIGTYRYVYDREGNRSEVIEGKNYIVPVDLPPFMQPSPPDIRNELIELIEADKCDKCHKPRLFCNCNLFRMLGGLS